MGLVTKTYTWTAGATIIAAEHNTNLDTLYNLVNGNIENVNIKASAAIVDTKLAQITTASKVSGSALTSLSSIPSGAGQIPLSNMSTNAVVVSGNQTIAGTKTFSSTISGNLSGNTTGTHTGSVALNSGTITGGTLGVSDQLSHNMGNGETFMIPSGYYINGVTRGSDGSIDTIYYCKL